jgi:C4-dicarboxylate-specific signal transduction histidine kinase
VCFDKMVFRNAQVLLLLRRQLRHGCARLRRMRQAPEGLGPAAIRISTAEAHSKGIVVRTQLAPNLPAVEGNFIQLEQVVLNLICNAIEAMEDKQQMNGAEPAFRIATEVNADNEVELTVRDNGPGLPSEMEDRVMEVFVTTKAYGLGMGLPISRSIIEHHGGRFWTSPGADRGVTFHMVLPAAEEDGKSA